MNLASMLMELKKEFEGLGGGKRGIRKKEKRQLSI